MAGRQSEIDPDDTWQAGVALPIGSISHGWEAKKKEAQALVEPEFPIGFDIRPGKNIKPQPHETWGPDPIVVWPKRRGK